MTLEERVADVLRERAGGERAQIVALKLALKEARDVFQHYGDLHAAKPDPVKARRNYDLAERMQAAINANAIERGEHATL
jgi:hypothetical protein